MKIKKLIVSLFFCFLIFGLVGCEAFVRKFTRKPKKESSIREEMVLAPQEYKGLQMSKEEEYRQYFLFWQSWHEELINALSEKGNRKKQVDCANETIKNLNCLRGLMNVKKQARVDIYINRLNSLKGSITNDLYGNSVDTNRQDAERIKRNILQEFSYKKIKEYLR